MSDINKQLENLYTKYCDKAGKAYKSQNVKISSPLLIKIDEKAYQKANKKIMIFGQETYGWHGEFGSKSIKFLQDDYFNYLKGDISDATRLSNKKKSAFWKAVNWFQSKVDDDCYIVWNNINKVGKPYRTKGINEGVRIFEQNYFSVIKSEIDILKPDIIIFLTGNRDRDIKFNFEVKSIENQTVIKKRKYKFAEIKFKNLKCKAVRLYHPSYYGGYNAVNKMALKIVS